MKTFAILPIVLMLSWEPADQLANAPNAPNASNASNASNVSGDKDPPPANVQGVDVSGAWTTAFDGAVAFNTGDELGGDSILTLKQTNTQVSGEYAPPPNNPRLFPPGSISGRLDGNILTGTWKDVTRASGTFEFRFDDKTESFTGWWKSADLGGSGLANASDHEACGDTHGYRQVITLVTEGKGLGRLS